MLVFLLACGGSRSFDGRALYRSGQMHALRTQLEKRDPRDATAAILYARNEIDLRVVWEDGSLDLATWALAMARTEDPTLAAELVQATGEVEFWKKLTGGTRDWRELGALFDRAIEMRKAAGDRRGVAESTFYRGLIAQFTEPMYQARHYWERARELGKDLDDPLVRSYPIRHLGDLAESEGDLVLAEKLHRESLALREQDGDVIRLFNARLTLATFLCERMRRCDEAAPQIAAARRVADGLRMPHGNVDVALLEAALAEWRGDLAGRDAAWTRALATASTAETATVMLARGAARLRAGDVAGALAAAQRVLAQDGTSREAQALLAIAAARMGKREVADAAVLAAWKDDKAPSARMHLARGDLDAALAAAKRDHDIRMEIEVLVARGELEAAKRRAQAAHLPLPAP